MKLWFDLTNSPHVNFFADLIDELRNEHDLVVTCRPLANTVELLELAGIPYHVVGRHYGASKIRKAAGFGVRVAQLVRFLRGQHIDAAISHSSFYSPIVSRALGVRCIYLNDNEHAAGNAIAFRFADRILIPEFLSIETALTQGGRPEKFVQYPGVKEGVYLWNRHARQKVTATDPRVMKKRIYVRPEPWTAQYYRGQTDFLDPILAALGAEYEVIVLPRGEGQRQHYDAAALPGVQVQQGSLSLDEIMGNCDLFIGAGGTMTREAAVLGIPTISVYQDDLLEVDKYLIKCGQMVHQPDLDAAFVMRMIRETGRRGANPEVLVKGREAYNLIRDTLVDPAFVTGGRA